MTDQHLGSVLIVAAPSGGGKTSLVKALINSLEGIEVSISHTTREARAGEVDGIHYFFIDEPQFLEMIEQHAFVEHARVFDYHYGSSVAQINDRLAAGIDVILDIDWQGAQQIRRLFPDALSIFILPPSLEILKQRLFNRQRDNELVIRDRMRRAQDELSHFAEFDYLIVNDDFNKAAEELKQIVLANRLRTARQSIRQRKLLSFLLA